ncbi:transient receptor potential cation channel subfamily M member 5 [Lates japonicus]|uniref:Transient receptor potential cation channel subfamily M member 5 n=1 Tax=Lates japonicus TaxID=270547 RepID=A0AAD3R5M8_LATJO|nr:transient receptor potential cation channel subfamily M member 5 [Lates japonicus]
MTQRRLSRAHDRHVLNAYANWLVILLLVIFLCHKCPHAQPAYCHVQRYNLIVEYHSRPRLAPPSHISHQIPLLSLVKQPESKQEPERELSCARPEADNMGSLLRIVGGFKDQEKRLTSMEAQIRYCGEVLSWMAECFAQSTLRCEKEVPRAPVSLTGSKPKQHQGRSSKSTRERGQTGKGRGQTWSPRIWS